MRSEERYAQPQRGQMAVWYLELKAWLKLHSFEAVVFSAIDECRQNRKTAFGVKELLLETRENSGR